MEHQNLLLNQKLISKTIMRTGDRIGQLENDTVVRLNESTMLHMKDTLILVKKPSNELKHLINQFLTFYNAKAGR